MADAGRTSAGTAAGICRPSELEAMSESMSAQGPPTNLVGFRQPTFPWPMADGEEEEEERSIYHGTRRWSGVHPL
eukprot:5061969-Prymnesium_polylepis.1